MRVKKLLKSLHKSLATVKINPSSGAFKVSISCRRKDYFTLRSMRCYLPPRHLVMPRPTG